MNKLKQLVKKYFSTWIHRKKCSDDIKQQISLLEKKWLSEEDATSYSDINLNVFTYHDEDGILLWLSTLNKDIPKTFVDIGSGDCIKSNCANFAVNKSWQGLFIDAQKKNIEIGQNFYRKLARKTSISQQFKIETVTPENINSIIEEAGLKGNIGLLSIDIDGNDYWIWRAIKNIDPAIVIIEVKVEYADRDIVTPYTASVDEIQNGASVKSMCKLAAKKGYRLVAVNKFGYNLVFVKNNIHLQKNIPAIPFTEALETPTTKESFYPDNFFLGKQFVSEM